MNRRRFLGATAALSSASALANTTGKPALLGGAPVKLEGSRKWPIFDQTEEKALLEVLRSGKWYRGSGNAVRTFEQKYEQLTGAKHCLATSSGTSALLTSLSAMGVTAGDEVILPPYTFVATLNVILEKHAMPIFVDSDPETFQMNARKVEAAITPRTKAILPVHMAGAPADLDTILATAAKHNVPVLEDACQAHLGEWRNRKVGTYGLAGCFSFQASKNLNSGEGGAVLTADSDLFQRCSAFHNNSHSSHAGRSASFDAYQAPGLNLRMTEFQAGLLVAQMTRLEAQSKIRESNARYLTSLLKEIPGIVPARLHDGCTRNAWHLYMLRYDKTKFANLPRAKFLKALAAEGVPASPGYTPLNKARLIQTAFASRGFQRLFSEAELKNWAARNHCPDNDQLCQDAVWFTQTVLLGPREDMDRIAEAMRKIQTYAHTLV